MKFTDGKRKKDIWMKFSANWYDRKEPNLKPYKIMFKGLHMKKHVRMLLVLQGHKIYSITTPTWLMNHLYVRKEARMIPSGYSTPMENGPLIWFMMIYLF